MIRISTIKAALVRQLKKTEDIDVFFTNVSKTESQGSGESIDKYFHVSLIPISTSLFGKFMRDRAFFIDVSYIDKHSNMNKYLEWSEKMDDVILPYIQIEERSITVETSGFRIVDEVGHYTFTLKFRDVIDYEQDGEPATDLNIKIK